MREKDGGAAFPTGPTTWDRIDVPPMPAQAGMSLRDYFAGQALPIVFGFIEHSNGPLLAQHAYEIADAMLAERAK